MLPPLFLLLFPTGDTHLTDGNRTMQIRPFSHLILDIDFKGYFPFEACRLDSSEKYLCGMFQSFLLVNFSFIKDLVTMSKKAEVFLYLPY